MILKIDHLGLAVSDIDDRLSFYEEKLGLRCTERETIESQKVNVAFLPIGESRIELLEPTAEESPIAGFLAKRGEGIHHLCLRVDDIHDHLARLKSRGVKLIHEEPFIGAGGALVAFIHPTETGGILLELSQPAPSADGE